MAENSDNSARFTDEMLLMTARLYYVDGLAQADVARVMHVSQPQVSRLLSLARSRGIVRISVADYDPRDRDLEKALAEKFGLRSPIVIKTIHGSKSRDLRYTVAHFAAADAAQFISQAKTVAIAGGRTLQDLCSQLKEPTHRTNLTVVQAMGNVGSMPCPYDALELGRTLAAKWNGSFFMLNTPVLLPDVATRDAIMNLAVNQQVAQRFADCDLAFIGIGTLQNSVLAERDIFTDKDIESLTKSHAIGEICGRFYDASGQECDTPFRDRVASITFEQIRQTPRVVAVTVGADRAEALHAAITGGLVKSVIMDDSGAQALLNIGAPVKKSRAKAGAGETVTT